MNPNGSAWTPSAAQDVLEHPFDGARPLGPGLVAVRAVAVVHEDHRVRRAHHVDVQVRDVRGGFLAGELLDVVFRAVHSVLLATPEREPDPLPRHGALLREPQRDLEHRGDPAAVVVEPGSLLDRVQVRAEYQHAAGATAGVGQDVERVHGVAPAVAELLTPRLVPRRTQLLLDVRRGRLVAPGGVGPVPTSRVRRILERLQMPGQRTGLHHFLHERRGRRGLHPHRRPWLARTCGNAASQCRAQRNGPQPGAAMRMVVETLRNGFCMSHVISPKSASSTLMDTF